MLHLGSIHVTVALKNLAPAGGIYEVDFLVDTGATDSLAPADELKKIGMRPVGKMSYELADGTLHEYEFGLTQIEFMGEVTAGRVIFGPSGAEPILGVTALESVGITIDPTNRTLKGFFSAGRSMLRPYRGNGRKLSNRVIASD